MMNKMKSIDIEKLKRENIYQTPDDFFSEVQRNVLARIQEEKPQKTGKIIPLFRKYAVAAAVLVFFGLGIFGFMNYFNNEEKITNINNGKPAEQQEKIITIEEKNNEEKIAKNPNMEDKILIPLSPIPIPNMYDVGFHEDPIYYPPSDEVQNIDKEIDEVLESYSSNELAALTTQVEQDIYLDIFND